MLKAGSPGNHGSSQLIESSIVEKATTRVSWLRFGLHVVLTEVIVLGGEGALILRAGEGTRYPTLNQGLFIAEVCGETKERPFVYILRSCLSSVEQRKTFLYAFLLSLTCDERQVERRIPRAGQGEVDVDVGFGRSVAKVDLSEVAIFLLAEIEGELEIHRQFICKTNQRPVTLCD